MLARLSQKPTFEVVSPTVSLSPTQIGVNTVLVIMVLAPLGYWLYRRRTSSLVYYLPIRRRVFSNQYLDDDEFQVTLEESPIGDLFLVQLEIENVCNRPVFREDFREPLKLIFNRNVRFLPLKAERQRVNDPVNYEVVQEPGATTVTLDTSVIRRGEALRLTFLYEASTYAKYRLEADLPFGPVRYVYAYENAVEEDYRYGTHRRIKHKRDWAAMPVLMMFMLIYTGLFLAVSWLLPDLFNWFVERPVASVIVMLVAMGPGMALANSVSKRTAEKQLYEREESEIAEREAFERDRAVKLAKRGHPYPGLE